MKDDSVITLGKIVIILSLLTISFSIGLKFGSNQWTTGKLQGLIGIDKNQTCSNLSLQEATVCLNNELSSWWQYNLTNINKTLSEAELKAFGGVCSHAAKWYVEKAQSLGFLGKEVKFWGDPELGHDIALLYDRNLTQYCFVDQKTIVGCGSLVPQKLFIYIDKANVTNQSLLTFK